MKVQQELMRHADIRATMKRLRQGHGREQARGTQQGGPPRLTFEGGLAPLMMLLAN
jgi:hypothetical protein